jgi:hypothetical protein
VIGNKNSAGRIKNDRIGRKYGLSVVDGSYIFLKKLHPTSPTSPTLLPLLSVAKQGGGASPGHRSTCGGLMILRTSALT